MKPTKRSITGLTFDDLDTIELALSLLDDKLLAYPRRRTRVRKTYLKVYMALKRSRGDVRFKNGAKRKALSSLRPNSH